MLDLRFFRNPTFSSATAAINLVFFAMFGTFFLLTQYLQLVLGYGTLEAGVRMLPMPFTMMVAAPSSAKFVEKFGNRKVVSTGLLILGLGLLLLAQSGVDTPYWHLVVAIVTMAVGMGLSMAPSTTGHHGLAAAAQGRRRLGRQRHHPGARRRARRRRARQPAGLQVHRRPARLGGAAAGGGPGGRPVVARWRPRRRRTRLPPAVGGPLAAAAKSAYVDAMSVSLVAAPPSWSWPRP